MNLSYPIQSLIPTLAGPVLEVLAGTTRPLTGHEVARLVRVVASRSGIQRSLDGLVRQGIVRQEPAGRAYLHTLNREHALAPLIVEASGLRERILDRMAEILLEDAPGVTRAIIFGSVARRDADESSDIDLMLVWPDLGSDDAPDAVAEIAGRITTLTGNECRIVQYSASEFESIRDTAPAFHAEVSRDGIDLFARLARQD